ncbi:MAG: hypothetical protein K1W31_00005, partial [Lachnospiraceae bacterium]
ESYNPNIHSQYLRARYYSVVTAGFLTEDSYLGNIREPLTLNRYNYCISSYLNYVDPSGVNNFMSCHRFNLTCCRKITHFPVTQSIVYTTIYFQSTAALRTAFSMFLSYIV